MSSRKKFLLIFGFIILNMFMLVSFLVIRDATMENELKNEMEDIQKLDITKDDFNTKIKTRGKYAIVEKAMKGYLNDCSLEIQDISKIINDDKLIKILSYDNYSNDGPSFTTSLEYLNNSKDNFNDKIDSVINKMDSDSVKNYIYEKTDDSYYVSLYNDLMLSKAMKSKFSDTKVLLEDTKTRFNNILDTSIEVLNFLVLYKDSWILEDSQIKFQNDNLYNYYNELISKVNTSRS